MTPDPDRTALGRIERIFAAAETGVLTAVVVAMLLLSAGQVVARNVFGAGSPAADTLLRHLVLAVAFVGASAAAGSGRHLHIEVVNRFLPARTRRGAAFATLLFASIVCALLVLAGGTFALAERAAGTVLIGPIPSWWAAAAFPSGFALLAVRFLLAALGTLASDAVPPDDAAL